LNGKETSTDCGGSECDSCDDGLKCMVNSDCKSKSCDSGTCTPSPKSPISPIKSDANPSGSTELNTSSTGPCTTGANNKPCQNGGSAAGTTGKCFCECLSAYEGSHCEKSLDSSVPVIKHAIHLRGISASEFNNNVKIIRSFIETIAKLLGIPKHKVRKVRACTIGSTEDSCPASDATKVPRRRRRQRRRLVKDDNCLVRYELQGSTPDDADQIKNTMNSEEFQGLESFTKEFKQVMTKNKVDKSMTETIVAHPSTSTTPAADTTGQNIRGNDVGSNSPGDGSGGEIAASELIMFIVGGTGILLLAVGGVYFLRQNVGATSARQSAGNLEMIANPKFECKAVQEWLATLEIRPDERQRLHSAFVSQDFNCLDRISCLTEDDLKELGINSMGLRKVLMPAILALSKA